jgi:hypothetical protein
MKFLSLKSRITLPQAIAWTMMAVILTQIYTDGGLQVYTIYQKSVDFADFCIQLIRQWIMNLVL